MSKLPEGVVPIDHPYFDREAGTWIYRQGSGFARMDDLMGRVVNIGTKDGAVYDTALVVDFHDTGLLVLDGGRKQYSGLGVVEVSRPESVHCDDIARGYVHPDGSR
jgi:hypothetical protein